MALATSETCNDCDREFYFPNQLVRHQEVKHRNYKCPKCDSRHVGIYKMRDHMSNCHGVSYEESMFMQFPQKQDPKFIEGQKCQFCPKRFKTEDKFARHLVNVHFLCVCPICNEEKRIGWIYIIV